MKLLRTTGLALLLASASAVAAWASTTYTLTVTGYMYDFVLDQDGNPIPDPNDPGNYLRTETAVDFTATYTSADPISTTTDVVWDSCVENVASPYTCGTATFDPGNPNGFGGTDTYLGFGLASDSDGTPVATGFLFFEPGALLTDGTYSNLGYPIGTPGYGNFAQATLTVEGIGVSPVPLPAGLPLLAVGLGALVVARRRGRA